MPTPRSVTVRTYNVGFGDCFALTFSYEGNDPDRYALIDFGSTRRGDAAGIGSLADAAELIREHCGGQLHLVVATHRHADHISGFAGRAGGIIAETNPMIVVQSWTEDPDIHPKANQPVKDHLSEMAFADTLIDMDAVARYAYALTNVETTGDQRILRAVTTGMTESARKELGFLGQTNIRNRKAVEGLHDLGRRSELAKRTSTGKGLYVRAGQVIEDEAMLPGVSIEVLGPPTVTEWEAMRRQRHEDDEEFWATRHAYWRASSGLGGRDGDYRSEPLFPEADTIKDENNWPWPSRWGIPALQRLRGDQLLNVVRHLDRALNNTSVVLLISFGGRTMLFPGDAQIESWLWPLTGAPEPQRQRWRRLLSEIDLYKVGHHGSRNATPKSLFGLWELSDRIQPLAGKEANTPKPDPALRMHSVVSTKAGVHGETRNGTEVPRETLMEALSGGTHFYTTLDTTEDYHDIMLEARS